MTESPLLLPDGCHIAYVTGSRETSKDHNIKCVS